MSDILSAILVFISLFILLWLSVTAGYAWAKWRKAHVVTSDFGIVKVAEGTVFALLGLLVAFSFSGAYDRYQHRKTMIIDEINAIDTVSQRIDLLKPHLQTPVRTSFFHYLDSRIALYKRMSDFGNLESEDENLDHSEGELWNSVSKTLAQNNSESVALLLVPAVQDMFSIATTRLFYTKVHPPALVFILLIGIASLCSALLGYSVAKNKSYNYFYIFCYVMITTFTLYIILELEFPGSGFIRMDEFDHLLIEERMHLDNKGPTVLGFR